MRETLDERAPTGDLALFLNTADDPLVERILTPRIAPTVAEHLAFERGRHVLVVMADMTSYCEAVREVSEAHGEIPSRRGYPGTSTVTSPRSTNAPAASKDELGRSRSSRFSRCRWETPI